MRRNFKVVNQLIIFYILRSFGFKFSQWMNERTNASQIMQSHVGTQSPFHLALSPTFTAVSLNEEEE